MGFQIENIKKREVRDKSFDLDELLKKEISLFGSTFSNKKKESFYSELYVLLQAGLELKDALELISKEQKKEADRKLIESVVEKLILGKNFSEALEELRFFTTYECVSIQIGEKTGTLNKVIEELGNYYKKRNEQKRMVLNALSYPIIILTTAFLAVFFMLQFVVPMFADIFKQNNVELPWITVKIINISTFFKSYYWVLFLTIIFVLVLKKLFKKKLWYKQIKSEMVLRFPFVGEFVKKVKIAQFTQAITLLLGAKVPLLNGIQLTQKMIDFYPLQQALIGVENDILIGKTLSESIKKHTIFDSKMVSLVKVAEETNQNQVIFERLTTQYNKDIEYKSKMLSTALEPLIILILGVIVATILIAMYIPMFKLSTVIG
ncbi:type II secretion system F family protein [Tenacibaculum caenipelagi]|uniref:Type IV pilus assembly protein PilC n=1 Tax=Tenacibaculum caenipelagi TaxID=1325435 RepID=A0A4R6TCD7_9FLAO|nr:type II secretion system F family protein [Tenacibaculum caenipelagi]TDQ21835.1 type IV pilus assembly protein PilC [Tenacibaculum caenipelagi]